jgi:excisionase family DNA binding protein
MSPITCSIKDGAKSLSVSRATFYTYIAAGKVETVKVGGRRLVKVASLHRLIGDAAPEPIAA